jgi:hypothetical protein
MVVGALLPAWTPIGAAEADAHWLTSGTFEGSPSLMLSNGRLELTVLQQGASMASIVLGDDQEKLNPLWDSVRLNRELGRKADPNTATGHIFAVDGFGPPSPEERQAGLPMLGEAHVAPLEVRSSKSGGTAEVTLTATLPIVQEKVTRTLRVVDGENVVYVESQLENLLGFDRPISWAEHATVGPPFVEAGVTVFDLSGTRSRTTAYAQPKMSPDAEVERRLASEQDFNWPLAPGRDGKAVDMRLTPDHPHYIDHTATLMDPARELEWVTALNPKHRLILGYLFRREDYPWLQTWGNYPPTQKPVRGLEFATQPFAEPRRAAISRGRLLDAPTFRWLGAKSTITTRFLLFYARVPDGFTKVDDVRLQNGQIIVEDHAAGKQLRLTASLKL